ncbi:MAG TPA: hypothetical protein VF469_40495 [Kofleriaceae bacterium]
MMRTAVLLSWVAAMPCGGGGPQPDAPVRTYRLVSSGVQLDPVTGPVIRDPDLATDVDAVDVHQDFFGVPWDAFATGAAPPPAWAAKMTDLAHDARATGKDIFLALAPLDGDRAHLAPNAVASAAGFDLVHGWKPACYDLATAADGGALETAYARYVEYMVRLFQPRWINVAVEVSLFHLSCPATWDGMVALEREAYDAAKRAAPTAPAFPSIQLDALYGRVGCKPPSTADQCYETEYAALADLARDRFAISTYPYDFAGFTRPEDIPADYLTRAAARGGERLFVAETGWLATDVVVTDETARCRTVLASSPTAQAAYFDRVVADAARTGAEVITWISNRDFLSPQVMTDCPCAFSQPWCDLIRSVRGQGDPTAQRDAEVGFKVFGTMGIRDDHGTPRQPIFDRWTAARALPVAP